MKKICLTVCILCMWAYPAIAVDLNDILDGAFLYLEAGRPDSAAVLLYDFEDTAQDTNQSVRTLYYLARAMDQLGRLSEQIQYLILAREASQDSEYSDDVQHAYARILLKTGNFEECTVLATDFRERFPESPLLPDMLYIAGDAYLSMEDYLRASNQFSEIIKNYPESGVALETVMKEGECLYYLKLITGAIERFEQYLRRSPDGGNVDEALYLLGLAYESREQPALAGRAFQQLTVEYPSHPHLMEAFFRLGRAYFDTQRFFEAENAFLNYTNNALMTDEYYDEALFYLERIKFRIGVYSSEPLIAENFISKYPSSPRTPGLIYDLAHYYRLAGLPLTAIDKYKVLMTDSLYSAHSDSAAYLIADSYSDMRQRESAVDFLRTIAHNTVNPRVSQKMFLKLADMFEKWESLDGAIAWYDSSLTIGADPDLSFKSLCGIARISKKLSRHFESMLTYERIIEEYPDHPNILKIYLILSDMYLTRGFIDEAISTREKSIQHAQNNQKADILFDIAGMYEETDESQALKVYSMIFDDVGNTPKQRADALLKFGDLSLLKDDRLSASNAYSKIITGIADSLSIVTANERLHLMYSTPEN